MSYSIFVSLVILVIAYVHITKIRSKVIIEIFRLSRENTVYFFMEHTRYITIIEVGLKKIVVAKRQ